MQDEDARVSAQQAEDAQLEVIESNLAKLEQAKRWGNKDVELFLDTVKSLDALVQKYAVTKPPRRIAAARERHARLPQSPAYKQLAAEAARAAAENDAYRRTPRGQCEGHCHDAWFTCFKRCTGSAGCVDYCDEKKSTCFAGCPAK